MTLDLRAARELVERAASHRSPFTSYEHIELERLAAQLLALVEELQRANGELADWALGNGDKRRLYGLMEEDIESVEQLRAIGQRAEGGAK